jgi:DNA mismatch endonuclease (patch repair protein)
MSDIFSKEKRSEVMSKIRSKNTTVERVVFSFLRKEKIYFQRHYDRVVGCPDVAIPSRKVAIFLDGDFWHGRNAATRLPKLNDWWRAKIERNMKRDRASRAALRKDGWSVLKVWEGELMRKRTREKWLEKIRTHLAASGSSRSWFVYLLRCADGTLYTGITTDLDRRLAAHNGGTGAKYTRGRGPVEIVWSKKTKDGTTARKLEVSLKKLSREAKEKLILTK